MFDEYMENKLYSDSEYLNMGFTIKELPLVKRHAHILNRYIKAESIGKRLPERQMAEMFELQARLDL